MSAFPTAYDEISDVFIAHASEDKEAVARPLAQALASRGWKVWLDEIELTIGDSLSRRIDSALSRTRFGVVVLSPAFFAKEWPQRELAGLAAREIDTGAKVILPGWHNVDHQFIAQQSPVLADRLGAMSSTGIETVAAEVSLALEASEAEATGQPGQSPMVATRAEDGESDVPVLFKIPVTDDEQAAVVREQPEYWEYRLFAGVLVQGRLELDDKWQGHELRLSGGSRRETASENVPEFLSRELGMMRRQIAALDRVLDPGVLENAFGAQGESGDPARIKRIARGVIQIYESMMDWAAALRNTSVPDEYEEILELNARMVDGPVRQVRDFIQLVADQIAGLPTLLKEAEEKGATKESPMMLTLSLTLSLDSDVQKELYAAFRKLS